MRCAAAVGMGIDALLQKGKAVAVVTRCPPPPAALFPPASSTAAAAVRRHSSATVMASAPSASDLAAIVAQKRALRSKVRKDLKALPSSLRSQEDHAIQSIVLNSSWFKSSMSLCAYISCDALREVDTSNILSEILKSSATGDTQLRKNLYVPRVEDKNNHMRMLCISRMDNLIANSMNILEPSPIDADGNQHEDVMLSNQPVDMVLLPGLAFDRSGRRLGRGGGYYDTFLRKYQERATEKRWKQPLLVALAYSTQIMDEGVIPVAPHDVSVDALVSPSGVIPISTAAAALERM